jgi:hypothetical protein
MTFQVCINYSLHEILTQILLKIEVKINNQKLLKQENIFKIESTVFLRSIYNHKTIIYFYNDEKHLLLNSTMNLKINNLYELVGYKSYSYLFFE